MTSNSDNRFTIWLEGKCWRRFGTTKFSSTPGYHWHYPLGGQQLPDDLLQDAEEWFHGITIEGEPSLHPAIEGDLLVLNHDSRSVLNMVVAPPSGDDVNPLQTWRLSMPLPCALPALVTNQLNYSIVHNGPVQAEVNERRTRLMLPFLPDVPWPVQGNNWVGLLTSKERGVLNFPVYHLLAISDRVDVSVENQTVRLCGYLSGSDEITFTLGKRLASSVQ